MSTVLQNKPDNQNQQPRRQTHLKQVSSSRAPLADFIAKMHFSRATLAVFLAFTSSSLAAPLPQLAGEGAACNSILSSTDNGVGYGIENAEDGIANTISGLHLPGRRQLAGEGAACNSILSSTDNGVGYGIENAEDNTAKLLGGSVSGTGGQPAPPPPKGPKRLRRQLDKIANGAQTVSQALGLGSATSSVTQALDTVDGESTSGAANLGAQLGSAEESTLESIGSAIPKRQLDKISNGFQSIANAAKIGTLTSPLTDGLDNVDGTSTGDAAALGAELGSAEEGTLEKLGSSIP